MKDKIETATLEDIAVIIMGQSPESNTYNHTGLGIPLLNGPTDFGSLNPEPTVWTTAPTKFSKPDDLLFCVRGSTTGRMNWANQRYCLGRGVASIRARSGYTDTRFIYYSLVSELDRLLSLCAGSVFPNLSKSNIENFRITWPDEVKRVGIVKILGDLDDKIELNRQMNKTLESMARAIFQSWFVDFDPTRAKLEDRTPLGMNDETVALFPDTFEDSELGKIPRGWQIASLDDVTAFVLGGDWGNNMPTEEETDPAFCIRGADIPDLQTAGLGKMPFRYLKPSSLEKRHLLPGDIVIEISGGSPTQSTGRPVLITQELQQELLYPLICSNFCRMLRLTSKVPPVFIYLWLRWLYTSGTFLEYENGTTGIKNLALTAFSEQKQLLLPSLAILNQFEQAVNPLFTAQQSYGAQSRTLATIRDTLLTKLLTGEIRVKDAEKYAVAHL